MSAICADALHARAACCALVRDHLPGGSQLEKSCPSPFGRTEAQVLPVPQQSEAAQHAEPQAFGVAAGQAHAPATQACARLVQARPQVPQFEASVRVSTQAPAQLTVPVGQHFPFEQVVPLAHEAPHAPQLSGSVVVSTQIPPPQFVRPVGQHVPLEQVGVAPEQMVPHVPQWAGSVARLTQASGQLSGHCAAVHPHVPPVQTACGLHAVAQPPQCASSTSVFTQTGFAPQSVAAGVPAQAQAPETQGAYAARTPTPWHERPHVPQYPPVPVERFTHVPPMPPGPVHASGRSAGHAQRPAVHEAPIGHACQHAPQLAALVRRSVQAPPQRVSPAAQGVSFDPHPASARANAAATARRAATGGRRGGRSLTVASYRARRARGRGVGPPPGTAERAGRPRYRAEVAGIESADQRSCPTAGDPWET